MTEKTLYVRLDGIASRVGILYCDKPVPNPNYGLVKLGADGPWAYAELDSLAPITAEEFQAALEGRRAPRSATKVYEQ